MEFLNLVRVVISLTIIKTICDSRSVPLTYRELYPDPFWGNRLMWQNMQNFQRSVNDQMKLFDTQRALGSPFGILNLQPRPSLGSGLASPFGVLSSGWGQGQALNPSLIMEAALQMSGTAAAGSTHLEHLNLGGDAVSPALATVLLGSEAYHNLLSSTVQETANITEGSQDSQGDVNGGSTNFYQIATMGDQNEVAVMGASDAIGTATVTQQAFSDTKPLNISHEDENSLLLSEVPENDSIEEESQVSEENFAVPLEEQSNFQLDPSLPMNSQIQDPIELQIVPADIPNNETLELKPEMANLETNPNSVTEYIDNVKPEIETQLNGSDEEANRKPEILLDLLTTDQSPQTTENDDVEEMLLPFSVPTDIDVGINNDSISIEYEQSAEREPNSQNDHNEDTHESVTPFGDAFPNFEIETAESQPGVLNISSAFSSESSLQALSPAVVLSPNPLPAHHDGETSATLSSDQAVSPTIELTPVTVEVNLDSGDGKNKVESFENVLISLSDGNIDATEVDTPANVGIQEAMLQ